MRVSTLSIGLVLVVSYPPKGYSRWVEVTESRFMINPDAEIGGEVRAWAQSKTITDADIPWQQGNFYDPTKVYKRNENPCIRVVNIESATLEIIELSLDNPNPDFPWFLDHIEIHKSSKCIDAQPLKLPIETENTFEQLNSYLFLNENIPPIKNPNMGVYDEHDIIPPTSNLKDRIPFRSPGIAKNMEGFLEASRTPSDQSSEPKSAKIKDDTTIANPSAINSHNENQAISAPLFDVSADHINVLQPHALPLANQPGRAGVYPNLGMQGDMLRDLLYGNADEEEVELENLDGDDEEGAEDNSSSEFFETDGSDVNTISFYPKFRWNGKIFNIEFLDSASIRFITNYNKMHNLDEDA